MTWYAIRVAPDLYLRKSEWAEPASLDHARRYTTRGAVSQSIRGWREDDGNEVVAVDGATVTVVGTCYALAAAAKTKREEVDAAARIAAPLREAANKMIRYRHLSGTAPCKECGR